MIHGIGMAGTAGTAKRASIRLAGLTGLGLVLLVSGVARAELQRVEAVGSYGIRESHRGKVIPREQAIQNALWEAVSRVARDVISERPPARRGPEETGGSIEGDPGPGQRAAASESGEGIDEGGLAALRGALGDDMLPYTRSFRIQDDLGEQPVMFPERPEIKKEYVVVVEVLVDLDRVTRTLEGAGLVARSEAGATTEIQVELLGLRHYDAFQRVRTALRSKAGAIDVRPIEFSPDRQVFVVEGSFEAPELATWLAGLEDERLVLEPVGIDEVGRRIRVVASWLPEGSNPAVEGSRGPRAVGAPGSARAPLRAGTR